MNKINLIKDKVEMNNICEHMHADVRCNDSETACTGDSITLSKTG